jgi:peptidoglycan hydrolase-like protein with peptidoglycan-binding domain
MKNKKILPYIIFGVPVLIGLFFVYKAIKNKKKNNEVDTNDTPEIPTTPTPTIPTYSQKDTLPFKKGNTSTYIGTIQRALGITDDNKFGSQTQSKVIAFQKSKGLKADGIVGAITWKALFGTDFPTAGRGTPLVFQPQQQQTGSIFGSNPF